MDIRVIEAKSGGYENFRKQENFCGKWKKLEGNNPSVGLPLEGSRILIMEVLEIVHLSLGVWTQEVGRDLIMEEML